MQPRETIKAGCYASVKVPKAVLLIGPDPPLNTSDMGRKQNHNSKQALVKHYGSLWPMRQAPARVSRWLGQH